MIRKIVVGDILDPRNTSDIIIGMNTELDEVTGIGLPFVRNTIPEIALDLGSVITFKFDAYRRLHMLICHRLGLGGWERAEDHIRYGLDYLNHYRTDDREFSIVQIGCGQVGTRDRAPCEQIFRAMATSSLPVDLYVYEGASMAAPQEREPLKPLQAFASSTQDFVPLLR